MSKIVMRKNSARVTVPSGERVAWEKAGYAVVSVDPVPEAPATPEAPAPAAKG